jgi:hypothetical protein
MSVTMHLTITTKEGCFDEFHALAKEELAFTRGSKGCESIHTTSSKDTNTLKFTGFGIARTILTPILRKELNEAGKTLVAY